MLKETALPDVRYWSRPQLDRGIDFNGFLWVRPAGNVLIDPLELDAAEFEALRAAGGAAWILLTNFDHLRAAPSLRAALGAKVLAPLEEKPRFGSEAAQVDAWYSDAGDLPGGIGEELDVFALRGGKSVYEAAFWLKASRALVFGDLVRCHRSGALQLLPAPKIANRAAVIESLRVLRELPARAVLLGDGDSVFCGGERAFGELLDGLEG